MVPTIYINGADFVRLCQLNLGNPIYIYIFAPKKKTLLNVEILEVFLFFAGAQMKRIHCKEKGKQQLSQQQVL